MLGCGFAKGAEVGLCKVGFAAMDGFGRGPGEAARRDHPAFLRDMAERGSHPRDLLPEGKPIVVLACDCSRHRHLENPLPHASRTYPSRSPVGFGRGPRGSSTT